MRVFDFTLLSGYEFSGVDVAQGFRARLFAKNNVNAKFIFTELPTIRDMELYGSQKIKRGQIMSAHLFMTGRLDMSLSVKKEALLENEKENYEYDNIDEDGKVIRLYNSGEKSVEILCDEDGFVINESLFKNGKKYLENYYTDSLSYTELYNWDNDSNDGLNLGRRIFWNKQGQMVYEQCIYKDNVDYLTGLYMRSHGQQVIAALMQDNDGCLAFIDMDNLKKVNDVHGHKAGDRALKLIGNLLAKETENETFAACRLGGDEFLIFMPYSDRASVESVIKRIFEGFESAREADCEIKEAALSAGLCMTTKGAMFESDYTKADKALYYVKQNCKGSYFFYEQLLADNKENTNLSADLRNVAKLLKESGSYTGALDLNYREFARIYEFVNNVGDRHNHNCYLVMVTMNTLPEQLADIEEIEKALDCMEQSIRSKIRKVDVCTRYSSMQYLIILFEPQENQIPNVMERIFMHYYELCDRENFKPQYEYIKMTEVK